MKALSQRQIQTCEKAVSRRCRCRCHGALHGVRRGGLRQEALFASPENLAHMAVCLCIEAECSHRHLSPFENTLSWVVA